MIIEKYNIIKRNLCTICDKNLKNIYKLDNFPIQLSCTKNAVNEVNTLSFSQCESCYTIQLDNLIPLHILYSNQHNNISIGKLWNNYFKLFCNEIKDNIKNKNILEIGCPSGKIALNLYNYNKWFIVEPNKNININFNEKIFFIESFFDDNFNIDEKIDMIIHSHLFEHIYEPNQFLTKCYELLTPNGEMFFGVPNMEHIGTNELCPFLGIFFEHTIFLNKENITFLLKKNKFKIIKIIDYENHSTLYHCKKIHNSELVQDIINFKITNYYNIFFDVLDIYKNFINKCNNIIKYNKEVYLFGASYNTQFLISLGLNIKNITGILDNSKEKENKYLYGYNLKIYNPNILINKEAIVILKNGYYVNEIYEQVKNINNNIQILI